MEFPLNPHISSEAVESFLDLDEADAVIWNPWEDLVRLDDDDKNEVLEQVRQGTLVRDLVRNL